jgi:hypothetical protein
MAMGSIAICELLLLYDKHSRCGIFETALDGGLLVVCGGERNCRRNDCIDASSSNSIINDHQSLHPSQHQQVTSLQSTLAISKNGKRLQTSVGMLPVRLFRSSERLTKDLNFINSKGIVPESSLLLRFSSADRCSKFIEDSRAGREREKITNVKIGR